jgi:hypothetical protein
VFKIFSCWWWKGHATINFTTRAPKHERSASSQQHPFFSAGVPPSGILVLGPIDCAPPSESAVNALRDSCANEFPRERERETKKDRAREKTKTTWIRIIIFIIFIIFIIL